MAQAGRIGVTDAATDGALTGGAQGLINGIAQMQASGGITQLGLESVIEESAPAILEFTGANVAGGLGAIKMAADVGQFLYEFWKCK